MEPSPAKTPGAPLVVRASHSAAFAPLDVVLPPHWRQSATPCHEKLYCPVDNNERATGGLTVQRQAELVYEDIVRRGSLGEFAARSGEELGYGKATSVHDGESAMGEFGYAVFATPTPLTGVLAFTRSPRSIFSWAFRGTDPAAPAVAEALAIARTATERKLTASPASAAFLGYLEALSAAGALLRDGAAAEHILAAKFMGPDGRQSESDRPEMVGVLEESEQATPLQLSFGIRFDADPLQRRTLRLRLDEPPPSGCESEARVEVSFERTADSASSEDLHRLAQELWEFPDRNAVTPPPTRSSIASWFSRKRARLADDPPFKAIVLGTRLRRSRVPATFSDPGAGTWVLLKIVDPAELYLAFDVEGGLVTFFPHVPFVSNAAAERLARAL